jgi:galactokinase
MLDGEIERFGLLMNASHQSLKEDFEVSCPALDELVEICLQGGACGARMTGAGFGGCVVALHHNDEMERLRHHLEQHFYQVHPERGGFPDYLFLAEPTAGAALVY